MDLLQISGINDKKEIQKDNTTNEIEIKPQEEGISKEKLKTLSETVKINEKKTDIFDYIKKSTSSPTIKKIKKQANIIKQKNTFREQTEPKETEQKEKPNGLTQIAEKESEKEKPNQENLTKEEIEFASALIVEMLDYGNEKLAKNALKREISETTKRQKERLEFAWARFLSTLNIRFSPIITVLVLTIIIYGFKYLTSKKILTEQEKEFETEKNEVKEKKQAKIIETKIFTEKAKEKEKDEIKEEKTQIERAMINDGISKEFNEKNGIIDLI